MLSPVLALFFAVNVLHACGQVISIRFAGIQLI